MAEPFRHAVPPDLPAIPTSLWREIADGSAGAGVRVAVAQVNYIRLGTRASSKAE